MSFYRICRVTIVALLIVSLAYSQEGQAIGLDPGIEAETVLLADPQAKTPCPAEEQPAIRVKLACNCALFVQKPVEFDMRIASLTLIFRLSPKKSG